MFVKKIVTAEGQQFFLPKLTVLVGPNNVGKSRTLMDIASFFEVRSPKTTIIREIEFEALTAETINEGLVIRPHQTNMSNEVVIGLTSVLKGSTQIEIQKGQIDTMFANSSPDSAWDWACRANIARLKVALLKADSRLQIAVQAPSKQSSQLPENLLQVFFEERNLDDTLKKAFKDAFDKDIKLDYSELQVLLFRVADVFRDIPNDPRDARPIMANHDKLDDQGDGFRSFVGIILSLLLSKGRVILIDEPEAFLHPTQARVLGSWIASFSKSSNTQIIIATHSANLLEGLLSQNNGMAIFRMNRSGNKTSFKNISPEISAKLAKLPLLSSQPMLESLFYEGVVVCEGDADRCVYESVYKKEHEKREIFFIHTFGKHTIRNVVGVLKEAEVPVCAIVDMDLLSSEEELKKVCSVLDQSINTSAILSIRKKIAISVEGADELGIVNDMKTALKQLLLEIDSKNFNLSKVRISLENIRIGGSKWNDIKKKGINGLDAAHRNDAIILLLRLKEIGLFIPVGGELESWIDLGVSKKNVWILKALEFLAKNNTPSRLEFFVENVVDFLDK